MSSQPSYIQTDRQPFHVTDVLDLDKLAPLFHSYTSITGTAAALIDLDGKVLIESNWKDSCTQFHRQNKHTLKRCIESDTALANDLEKGVQYTVYRCKNGLVDAATPIVIGGYHVANVFTGQLFLNEPDLKHFKQQANDVGFDEQAYLDAIARVPVFTEAEIKRNMEFLVQLAEMIGETGMQHLKICQANEELTKAKELAEVASEAKSVFLSRMSHELRTPLNAVLGFSQLLKMEIPESNTNHHEQLDCIVDAGDHLLALISDIMDVVSLDSRGMKIPLSDISLATVIDESLSMVRHQAETQSIRLIVTDVDFCVHANSLRLKQVIMNLLTNAIKYNRTDGSVTVKAERLAGNQIKVSIIDTGVGIDPKETQQLFKLFSRLNYAEKSAIQGTGIGLSLCKYLIEEMQGTIQVESSEKNKGTCFTFTIREGTAANMQLPDKYSSINSLLRDNSPQVLADGQGIKGAILYIEDSSTNRKLLELVAAKYPQLVFESAKNAEEGIDLAKRIHPSLIIMDINLPNMSGIDAVRLLRDQPPFENTQIIALSADALPEQIEKAMEAGFDGYFSKPIELPKIIGLLNNISS